MPTKKCDDSFDSRVEQSMLVEYFKKDAYKVYLSSNCTLIKTKNITFEERFGILTRSEMRIEFDLDKFDVILMIWKT